MSWHPLETIEENTIPLAPIAPPLPQRRLPSIQPLQLIFYQEGEEETFRIQIDSPIEEGYGELSPGR